MTSVRARAVRTVAAALVLAAVGAGCGSGGDGGSIAPGAPGKGERVRLRLGYFANLTHATALVGLETGIFARALGGGVELRPSTFNAGPAAVEALFAGAVDATYIGPNPAINAYAKSGGEAVRIVSGATSGGAALVVKPGIGGPSDLKGRIIATPQLGNTQDVALRHWLGRNGLRTDLAGGGEVSIRPQDNAQTLETFRSGQVDGAWVPEPWATRLVRDGGGRVLVDERDLWPGGRFVTTHLVVRTAFLARHPDVVRRLIEGQVEANDMVNAQPAESQRLLNAGIEKVTGRRIDPALIEASWPTLTFTNDPIAGSLFESARHAIELGLLDKAGLARIYALGPLNQVLAAKGGTEVLSR